MKENFLKEKGTIFLKYYTFVLILFGSMLILFGFKSSRKNIITIVSSLVYWIDEKKAKIFIKENFLLFQKIFFYGIILYVGLQMVRKIYYNIKKKREFDEGLDKCLYNYLISNDNQPRSFLVEGDWGSGKTYRIKSFFEKYLKYRDEELYYISCFGIDSRSELLNEIKKLIENKDESLGSKFINIIKGIPIFGDGIYNILRPDYDLHDIKKGSIFIFDDFERICATENRNIEDNNKIIK